MEELHLCGEAINIGLIAGNTSLLTVSTGSISHFASKITNPVSLSSGDIPLLNKERSPEELFSHPWRNETEVEQSLLFIANLTQLKEISFEMISLRFYLCVCLCVLKCPLYPVWWHTPVKPALRRVKTSLSCM
jgi:hypothetical protein